MMKVHRGKKHFFWQNSQCLEAVWLLIDVVKKSNMLNRFFMEHIAEKFWRKLVGSMNSWGELKIMNFIIESVKQDIKFAILRELYLISMPEVHFQEC